METNAPSTELATADTEDAYAAKSPAAKDGLSAEGRAWHHEELRETINALLRISLESTTLEDQLHLVLRHVTSIEWLALESRGAIFLTSQSEPNMLVMKAQENLAEQLLATCAKVPFGTCLCGRAAKSRRPVFADCIDHRHDVRFEGMAPHGHYCVPILHEQRVLGVITLYVRAGHAHSSAEEGFLATVGDIVAEMVLHKQTQSDLEAALSNLRRTLGTIIQAMGATLEMRDPYTAGHQRRVADLARTIAVEMGLTQDQVEAVRSAGVVHDIGKISVPSEILCKPGKLTDTEYELIQAHAKIGYDILRTIDFQWPIAQIVLQHHERWDGSGYPAGLSGQDILVEARILGVADTVEAMASHRPYRPALGIERALKEIESGAGTLYDPQAANACLTVVREKGFAFR